MPETTTFLSRRHLIGLGAAALAVPYALAGQVGSDIAGGSLLKTTDRELKTYAFTDPEFDSKLGALFPGLASDPKFQMIAPVAIIITHVSGPAVRAYSTCWSTSTASGSYETALFKYSRPGVRRNGKIRAVSSAQKDILLPGQSILTTPYFNLTPQGYHRLPKAWHDALLPHEPANFIAAYPSNADGKRVWIDAVVFKDRKVLGVDKHHLAERLRVRRHAEHDVALDMQKLVKSGASHGDIEEALLAKGTAPRSSERGKRMWYTQAKKHHAQLLLKKYHSLGPEKFTKLLARVVRIKRTVLPNVTA
jgi:hypothetical protein